MRDVKMQNLKMLDTKMEGMKQLLFTCSAILEGAGTQRCNLV